MNKLFLPILGGFAFLILLVGGVPLVSAGTLDFWQAWFFLAVFFASAVVTTADLWVRDKSLLERRLNGGPTAETEPAQKVIQTGTLAVFLAMLIVPGLDRRWGWSHVPVPLVLAGETLTILGLWIVFRVFQVNSFAAATVSLAEGQRVVSSGPYRFVRHPMYAGGLILVAGMSLALGSWWDLLGLIPFTVGIVFRLLHEESFLVRSLVGYSEYQQKVRYRLVPGIW